jgi:2-oxoacid:acceptor oxidoreductase gamma subunit (pyruvate/2-ketoisovalerate family)
MREIRWHGRGGQGAVVAARVLTAAFDKEGKSAMAFPKYGAERRGAPVIAFSGFDDRPIREKTELYEPDCLVVLDPTLVRSVKNLFDGIKPGAVMVINSPEAMSEWYNPNLGLIGSVDATRIGLEEIGRPITNTCMLGVIARTTGWIKLDSILASLPEYFSGKILERNLRCIQRGFDETRITQF